MSVLRLTAGVGFAALVIISPPIEADAHGFAGQRFFPATILTDDPFVADEMSLPTITRPPSDADGAQQIGIEVELAKRITPDIGITIGQGWNQLQPQGRAVTGLRGAHAGAVP